MFVEKHDTHIAPTELQSPWWLCFDYKYAAPTELRTVYPAMNEETSPDIVDLPIEDVLDLHSFRPNEIKSLVEDYLHEAYERGFLEVRIIHGKGIGVQREIVQSVARRTPYVESVRLASEEAGDWGASIIRFRPRT
jgi:dsDNA-specific endonuclease/ATPase MutS2